MRGAVAAAFLALAALAPGAARAENLLLALSSQEITIASNFAGSDVTLFGAIRPDARSLGRPGEYDLVVTARGPSRPITVREKRPAGPIWVNRESRPFPSMPSYFAVRSNRPLDLAASAEERAAGRLGLLAMASAAPQAAAPGGAEFAEALVRLQRARKLWSEDEEGVSFLDRTLFRATLALPPNVPIGAFEVEVRLLSRGATVARETIAFRVVKAGFEAGVARAADEKRLAYGAAAALVALAIGWAASVAFRRD